MKACIEDGVRFDELPVGKKVQVRDKDDLYTIERRDDGLYISYGYPHLSTSKCWSIGCRPHPWKGGEEVEKKNFVGIGMYMKFSVNDVICGEGGQIVNTGIVVEITAV
jgi:hypothetical protein